MCTFVSGAGRCCYNTLSIPVYLHFPEDVDLWPKHTGRYKFSVHMLVCMNDRIMSDILQKLFGPNRWWWLERCNK